MPGSQSEPTGKEDPEGGDAVVGSAGTQPLISLECWLPQMQSEENNYPCLTPLTEKVHKDSLSFHHKCWARFLLP